MEVMPTRKDVNYPKIMVVCAYLYGLLGKRATPRQIILHGNVVYYALYQALNTLEMYGYIERIYEGNKNYIQLTTKGIIYAGYCHKILSLIPHDYSNTSRRTL